MYGNVGDWFNELPFLCYDILYSCYFILYCHYDILYCRQLFQLLQEYLHFSLTVHCNSEVLRYIYKYL